LVVVAVVVAHLDKVPMVQAVAVVVVLWCFRLALLLLHKVIV
jgi:hypothetical protein